ncbi:MAG: DUF5615 family PIN-like protein [Deltaproteobacteria bacterium]|nr:DUF5615 family PIN-like protein [Deltaproteobacteria bacterium]
MMKIFVDENIPLMIVQALREEGHDVLDIRGTTDEGMDDESLWKILQDEKRLLITTDKGFARHRNSFHCGIMIIRLRQPNRQKIHQRVMNAVGQFKTEDWRGQLVIIRDMVQSSWRFEGD